MIIENYADFGQTALPPMMNKDNLSLSDFGLSLSCWRVTLVVGSTCRLILPRLPARSTQD